MNLVLKPIIKAMEAELTRQHEHSSIHGLVVSQTEEPSVLQVTGPIDLEALAQVVWEASLTQAEKTVHNLVQDMTDPQEPVKLQAYVYDCRRGQGSVMATSLEQARRRAQLEAGLSDPATNVHLATEAELAFRKTMGGDNA